MTQTPPSPTHELYRKYHTIKQNPFTQLSILSFSRCEPAMLTKVFYQDYHTQMVDAICNELQMTGACWLLERLPEFAALPLLDSSAVFVAHNKLIAKKPLPADERRIPGTDCAFTEFRPDFMTKQHRNVNRLCEELLAKGSAIHQEYELQQLRRQVSDLTAERDDANRQLNEIKVRADELQVQIDLQAGSAIEEARTRLLDEARQQAADILHQAGDEAAQMRQEAYAQRAEAQQRQAEADAQAEALLIEARRQAGAIVARAEADSADRIRRARHAYAEEETAGLNPEEYSQERAGICDHLSELQRTTLTGVSDYISQLSDMMTDFRHELARNLDGWKSTLFKANFTPLANYYVNLYRYITNYMDKLITRQRSADIPAGNGLTADDLLDIQGKLLRYHISLERAMSSLGLVIIRPQPGEQLIGTLHMTADDDGLDGQQITACSCPGVKASGEYGEVFLRAEVTVASDPAVQARPE